jgi:periplasmic protein TonB
MIRCVLFASVALHVAMFAVLPGAPPLATRAPETPSLVEVASDPPPPKEEPQAPAAAAPTAPAARVTAAPRSPSRAAVDTSATAATTEAVTGLRVDGDGPADFTASVISNAAVGPASKIVVSAPAAVPPPEPKMVPVSSLSRRPGAPGLDAELERNYPIEARRAGISGTAKLRVRILPDGRVGKVEPVSESYVGFGEACARTVRAARWEPPLDADGRPVATEIVYVCKFEVRS